MAVDLKITVCTITYRRPKLLGHMVYCFEHQTYANRELIVLDDSGELAPARGDRWRLYSVDRRYPTLAAKRNACARLAPDDTDVLVVWDDDDLYLPWALEATAAGCQHHQWSRPSVVCYLCKDGNLWQIKSHSEGRTDKANQCAWGIDRDLFWAFGGYDESRNQGEDCDLAKRLDAAGILDSDPIEMGFRPWYIWGPHENQHISEPGQVYETWRGDGNGWVFGVEPPPGINLRAPRYLPQVDPRPWQQDWYEEVV